MSKDHNEVLTITILNWDKYQNKKGGKWCKLYDDIVYSNSLHKLPISAKWLFICLLSECSRRCRGTIEVSLSYISHATEMKPSRVRHASDMLTMRSIISMVSGEKRVPRLDKIRVDKIQQVPPAAVFDFEKLYLKYPKKKNTNKKRGMQTCKNQIKELKEYEDLEKAIDNYNAYLKKEKTDPRYFKSWSTFMNQWEEWVALSDDAPQGIKPFLDFD